MDPVSQAVFGASFAQTRALPKQLGKAAVIGAIAGMAPDLDILIRSESDPLLDLEFHRHFTHSLFFIPIGGAICSFVLHPLLGKRWQLTYWQTLLWCIIGFATHGLLDGCTSYGTQLLWPLSDQRFSWSVISIIDPLLTIPLITLVFLACKKQNKRYTLWALIWMLGYLSIGFIQHHRAEALGYQLAETRGHNAQRLDAKPSFANLAVWKIIYEAEGKYYVDAVKPGLFSSHTWEGEHVSKLDISRDFPWLTADSQQTKDIERFRWFSDDFIAVDPNNPNRVMDMRYSMLPNSIKPLWGIELNPEAPKEAHITRYMSGRDNSGNAIGKLLDMIFK